LRNCHRCTRVENPSDRIAQIFAKIPGRGVKAFRTILPWGVPYFGCYCIFFNKSVWKYAGGPYIIPPSPPSPSPPVCIYAHYYQKNPELDELQRCSYSYDLLCLLPYVTIRSKLIATRIHVGLLFKSKVKKRLI
jgi:hypothetical protein